MSKIGIVISSVSKMVRRVVVPSDDISEIDNHPLVAGETMLVIDAQPGAALQDVSNLVFNEIGIVPSSSRCAVVVKANAVSGNVVNIIQADPAIDSVSGSTLMLHPTAAAGWTWSAAQGLQPPAHAV